MVPGRHDRHCGLGRRFGALSGRRVEILGGVILTGIGVKILIDHIF